MPRRTYNGRQGRARKVQPAWDRWEWLINELDKLNRTPSRDRLQTRRDTGPRNPDPHHHGRQHP